MIADADHSADHTFLCTPGMPQAACYTHIIVQCDYLNVHDAIVIVQSHTQDYYPEAPQCCTQHTFAVAGCRDEEPGWRGTAYATLLAVGMEDGDAGIIS